jgi:hypothetical protein
MPPDSRLSITETVSRQNVQASNPVLCYNTCLSSWHYQNRQLFAAHALLAVSSLNAISVHRRKPGNIKRQV